MDWRDVLPAHLKTVVFGWLVAVIGCYNGIYVDGGTEGVGRAATRGVVQSILAVVLVNVVLVRLIQILQAA
jgi:phospholipid/cholesterol/gamma-HCH transport system permease protein